MNKLVKQKAALVTALMVGVGSAYTGIPDSLLKASEVVQASENVQETTYVSTDVNGSDVTFRYYTTTSSTIQVKGSFDQNQDQLYNLIDKDGNGIYEYTLKNLPDGIYEYRFVVDGEADLKNKSVDGNNNTFTINTGVDYVSPMINGNQVTLKYQDSSAEKVEICGTIPNGTWTPGDSQNPVMTKEEGTNIWTYTFEDMPAGTYQYKFVVDGSGWNIDPKNPIQLGGNSGIVVEGLAGGMTSAESGSTVDLPDLDYYDLNLADSGYSKKVTPTYSLTKSYDGVTLDGNKLVIPKGYEGNIELEAKYEDKTSVYTVEVVGAMYEYTIHYYEPDSDYSNRSLWLWYNEVNGSEVSFNGSQYTDELGRKWATATYKLPTEAINIIVKSTGGWDFKDLERPNIQKDTQTGRELWIVAGDDTIYSQEPEAISTSSRCLVLEFYKPEKDYNAWEAYSWTTVSANQHFIFNTKGDKGYATIPVAKGAEGCSFVIPKVESINESDWIKDITADRYVEMPVDQNVIKARVTYGDPEIKVLPYNIGYEADPGKGTLTFYYRDDELFKDGLLETLQKVQVEVNGTVYDMTYDAVNERYTYVMNNVTEGEYTYCYHVTDAVGNTQTYLDAFNTAEKEGKSLAIYKRLEMSVTGSVEPGSINYNENAVLTIDVDYDQTETDVIKQCYVDLSPLGGPEKVEVDKEIMALSISVDQSVTTGNKEIPIMVLDKYGETHRGSVTVNVKPRYVDQNDFDWDEAIIYFMETDRFNDGDTSNNEPFAGVDDYDLSDPGKYHGGDFKGVTEKLDYLKGLGVNTIWISPIVENVHHNVYNDGPDASYYGYHGYWALNFERLNPHLGSIEDLHKLIDEAHARGIKIMLDVVVNHAGYGVKEGDTSSKSGYPTTEDQSNFTDMFRTENVPNSEILTELSGLPDFKTEDPKVREQVINWQANWVENLAKTSNGNSIDYFRIDTVKHVEKATWMALKNKMTEIDPEFKMMGEYWAASADNNFGYLNSGTMDGLIDFGFKDIAKEFVSGNLESAEAALERRNEAITNTAVLSQYLSSHDVDGFLTSINNDFSKYMLAVSLQLTAKGQPIIYYGEELGQTGLNDYPVQTNRYDLDWSIANDENPIFVHYKKLLAARNAHTDVFAKGTRSKIAGSDAEGYLCVKRSYNNEEVVLGFNYGEAKEVTLDMPGVSEVVDLYSGNVYKVVNNQVKVTLPCIEEGGTAIFNIVKRNISNGSSNSSNGSSSSSNGSSSSSNGSQSTSSSTGTTTSNTQKESTNTAADKVTVNSIDNKKIELKISTDENTSIEKALDKKEVANIQLESGKAVQISRENVQKAVDMQQSIQFIANHASFVLSDAQLKEVLTDNSQNSLLVAGLAMDSKVINTIKEQLAKEGKMTLVGGEKETIQIVINNGDTIAEFNEPMDVTIDLSDIAEVNAQKLTLVKYEYQADGTYKVIKVGGQYDDKTKTLTAKVSETGNYGVVETDELSVIELVIDNKVFTLNGKNKNNDVAPQIVRGNTMVPLRFIAENLGAEVKYDSKAKKVYINLDGQKLEMTIGQEIKGYEIAPMIEKGRTLVPLRYVSEQLGAHVLWVPSQKAIRIVK